MVTGALLGAIYVSAPNLKQGLLPVCNPHPRRASSRLSCNSGCPFFIAAHLGRRRVSVSPCVAYAVEPTSETGSASSQKAWPQ
jgi:hypothetical protein